MLAAPRGKLNRYPPIEDPPFIVVSVRHDAPRVRKGQTSRMHSPGQLVLRCNPRVASPVRSGRVLGGVDRTW